MPPGAQIAQGSQPFHLDLNSGLRTPLFISLFFFFLLRCHQQSEVWGALISRVCGASFYSIRELRAAGERLRESLARNLLATTLQGWTPDAVTSLSTLLRPCSFPSSSSSSLLPISKQDEGWAAVRFG